MQITQILQIFHLTMMSIICPAEIAEMAEMGFARPCGMIILTQRRRERRGHTDILFRTRIYRIPRIDDNSF